MLGDSVDSARGERRARDVPHRRHRRGPADDAVRCCLLPIERTVVKRGASARRPALPPPLPKVALYEKVTRTANVIADAELVSCMVISRARFRRNFEHLAAQLIQTTALRRIRESDTFQVPLGVGVGVRVGCGWGVGGWFRVWVGTGRGGRLRASRDARRATHDVRRASGRASAWRGMEPSARVVKIDAARERKRERETPDRTRRSTREHQRSERASTRVARHTRISPHRRSLSRGLSRRSRVGVARRRWVRGATACWCLASRPICLSPRGARGRRAAARAPNPRRHHRVVRCPRT